MDDMPNVTVANIAYCFALKLSYELTPEQFGQLQGVTVEILAQEKDYCASHDYLDANEVMAEVFHDNDLPTPVEPDIDPLTREFVTQLWEDAWDFAKSNCFNLRALYYTREAARAQLGRRTPPWASNSKT